MTASMLKNMNLFVDGQGKAGKVEEFSPPKLVVQEEDYRAGGMDAAIGVDMGMEKLEASFVMIDYDADVLKLFGMSDGSAVRLTARGAAVNDEGEVVPVVVNLRGRLVEVDPGTWKPGESAKTTHRVSCRYYKQTVSGEVVHEVDVDNMVRVINGVDQLAAQRSALAV